MKKIVKIGISCFVGAALLTSLAFNYILSVEAGLINTNSYSGTIVETWTKYDVNIPVGGAHMSKLYAADGVAYIENLKLDEHHSYNYDSIEIHYLAWEFSTFDDLESYFVFTCPGDKTYTTPVEVTHIPFGGERIFIKDKDLIQEYDLFNAKITEVHIRLVD